ncbi:MAG: hypothetical protein AAF927_21945 [Bacteroidota bacterium]
MKKYFSSARLPYWSLTFCGAILLFSAANVQWNPIRWEGIVRSDGKGYFAYLPAVWVYQDLNFDFFDALEGKKYFQKHLFYDYRFDTEGGKVNRYYAGTAFLLSPFYLVGHAVAKLAAFDPDGYSLPYYISVHFGAIFYSLLGLYLCLLLLRDFKIDDVYISLVLPAILLGTNFFYYPMMEALMSHHFSFCMLTGLLLATRRWLVGRERAILWMGICMGTIVLLRPINLVVLLLLPFMAESLQALGKRVKDSFQQNWSLWLIAILVALLIGSVQLWCYYLATGSPWVYSYGPYKIDLGNPHFWEMLFSYRKGFFLYTPLALVGMGGFYFWGRINLYQCLGTLSFILGLVYLLSCWDFWFYGGSFGGRVFIDYYAIWAILLGFCWQHLKGRWQKSFTVLVLGLILVCQIQTFQYRYQHILWDKMTKELYWDRFLRIDRILWPEK